MNMFSSQVLAIPFAVFHSRWFLTYLVVVGTGGEDGSGGRGARMKEKRRKRSKNERKKEGEG